MFVNVFVRYIIYYYIIRAQKLLYIVFGRLPTNIVIVVPFYLFFFLTLQFFCSLRDTTHQPVGRRGHNKGFPSPFSDEYYNIILLLLLCRNAVVL